VHRLFLDANVLFTAAHNPEGKAAFLFDALRRNTWDLITTAYAIEEARRNITAKYPHCEARLNTLLRQLTLVAQPGPSPISIRLPEKDQPIFLAARAAKATHLLTGDLKHFGPAMNKPHLSDGIVIQTVAEFLSSL
jgi:predicted nucleic acid-binding protein